MPRTDLANCILDHIGMGDGSALRIKELLRKPQPESEPAGAADGPELGSTLDALVLWDMPPEDQKEFQGAQELIVNRRIKSSGWTLVERKARDQEKRSAKNRKITAKPKTKNKEANRRKKSQKPKAKSKSRNKRRKVLDTSKHVDT